MDFGYEKALQALNWEREWLMQILGFTSVFSAQDFLLTEL